MCCCRNCGFQPRPHCHHGHHRHHCPGGCPGVRTVGGCNSVSSSSNSAIINGNNDSIIQSNTSIA